jgi:endo-1,4-beta-xylanase
MMLRLLPCLLIFCASVIFAQKPEASGKAAKPSPFAWVSPIAKAEWAAKLLPPTVKHATFKSPSMSIDVGYYIYLPPGYETSQ